MSDLRTKFMRLTLKYITGVKDLLTEVAGPEVPASPSKPVVTPAEAERRSEIARRAVQTRRRRAAARKAADTRKQNQIA